ncbi:MAG TPA: VOC family protein [Gemmatimonadaceae bacterium]|nr:VOC family protein [Gemmatimonadaceae bacterium]
MKTHGTFTWNELATADVEGAKEFYSSALGWVFEQFPMPEGEYWVAKVGDQYVAGLTSLDQGSLDGAQSPYWFPWIEVDDVDARLAAASKRGATILRPSIDVPNVGRVAVVRDPSGAAVGWMTSVKAAVPA